MQKDKNQGQGFSRRRFLKYSLLAIGALGLGGGAYLSGDKFGASPQAARLARILASPNYRDGEFRNYEPFATVDPEHKQGFLPSMKKFLLPDKGENVPLEAIPAVKTDLRGLNRSENLVVWLGHSSAYLQVDGVRLLLDPVFSRYASPVPGLVRAFEGTELYTPQDIPDLDVLLLTHDHWDHLDYETVRALLPRTKRVICPLGVGAHLELWGARPEQLTELDWYEGTELADGGSIELTPARHFSGRMLKRNQTLWGGYALLLPRHKIFFSGDGGYGKHFKSIGEKYGGFDLALMECGQYNLAWHSVHLLPEESAQAAAEVKAAAVLPIHAGKFSISYHNWQEPYERLLTASAGQPWWLLTPRLGEVVKIDKVNSFSCWWQGRK